MQGKFRMRIHSAIVTALLAGCFASAVAQTAIRTIPGSSASGAFGDFLARAGDLDQDGLGDIWAHATAISPTTTGIVAYSGRDGSVLRTISRAIGPDVYGAAIGGGRDVDGDGIPDVALSIDPQFGSGTIEMRSGATGALLWARTGAISGEFAGSILMIDDVNGDGAAEVAVVSTPSSPPPFAMTGGLALLSGANGQTIWSTLNAASYFRSPHIASAGDWNGDGYEDIVGGFGTAYAFFFGGLLAIPTFSGIYVASGLNGAPLASMNRGTGSDDFGWRAVGVGDITGDGVPEIAATSPRFLSGGTVVGRIEVIDLAAGGLVVTTIFGTQSEPIGANLDGGADPDGDGIPDICYSSEASTGTGSFGVLRVSSTISGQDIWSIPGENDYDGFGAAAIFCGDVNFSNRPSVAVSRRNAFGGAGAVEVRLGIDGLGRFAESSILDPVTSAPLDALVIDGSPGGTCRRVDVAVGQPFTIGMNLPFGVFGGTFAIFALLRIPSGADAINLPAGIGTMSLMPCALSRAPDSFLLTDNFGGAVCGGAIIASQPAPWTLPVFSGVPFPLTVTLQGVMLTSPGTVRATNGVLLRIR